VLDVTTRFLKDVPSEDQLKIVREKVTQLYDLDLA